MIGPQKSGRQDLDVTSGSNALQLHNREADETLHPSAHKTHRKVITNLSDSEHLTLLGGEGVALENRDGFFIIYGFQFCLEFYFTNRRSP